MSVFSETARELGVCEYTRDKFKVALQRIIAEHDFWDRHARSTRDEINEAKASGAEICADIAREALKPAAS